MAPGVFEMNDEAAFVMAGKGDFFLLKKVMFFLMTAYSAVRFLAMSYMISTQADRLPAAVYIATGISVATGLFLLCKCIIFKIRTRQMEFYYGLTAAAALFNLVFVKYSSRLDVTFLDLLVIGTALDILFSAALIVLAEKERKYVRIPVRPGKS